MDCGLSLTGFIALTWTVLVFLPAITACLILIFTFLVPGPEPERFLETKFLPVVVRLIQFIKGVSRK